ncbi:polysaccharide deacetylase family protein [Labrys monachus]|uniref:Chitooligosaccharide deacetylase n=1 Tax=Labrys monachus TaxID=217067 RepID=A0ABU0FH53_9HYPH|nr:polysaccharide deacetylase family protein [Labrys monachus]MDQ0393938.1 peptidoglycan/xylan/chitin deacetylase (PgdA/CDA1 family) [Labrys monachus]
MTFPSSERDFIGYGENPPAPRWPGEARVAVSFVVNIEEGAEHSIADGDDRNEGVYEAIDEIEGYPDPCQDTHYEYGTRIGYWRIMQALAASDAPATLSACGRAIERSPWLARDGVARGHEISCHGWRWERHAGMAEAAERVAIARTAETIRRAAGVAPVGWHTRSAPSVNTRRLLIEHGGFLYDSDAYNDELPYFASAGGRRHVVLPYSFDTNDMHFHSRSQRFVSARDFADYVVASYDRLWREGAHQPRMMSVGLHLRMIGRAGRIDGLETVLRHMRQTGGTWIARRDAIARHWLARFGEAA